MSGGPGKDIIPSIDHPEFMPASEAEFLRDEDAVFGIFHRGEPRAYPQLILVWHEIVNDQFSGEPVSITYSPLAGSVVAFQGGARDGTPLTFGTTGKLLNSNLVLYDRATDSQWPQLLATAVSGPEQGSGLTEIPLVWASWRRWRDANPDTAVLSTNTGFRRAYGDGPYGSYAPLDGYYADGDPMFPVMASSDRLPPKEVVVGIKAGTARIAIHKRLIEQASVLPLAAEGAPLVAIWDAELQTSRVFLANADGQALRFQEGERLDSTGSHWSATGEAISGPLTGTRLAPMPSLDIMWFAWYAFFPETELVV